jgi:hypothetical protein
MTDFAKKVPRPWARFVPWIKDQWVRSVPGEIAVCEFDCRKDQCLEGEWVSCERRITRAAGELRPDSPKKDGKT